MPTPKEIKEAIDGKMVMMSINPDSAVEENYSHRQFLGY